jgi:hypothetical protein
VLMDSGTRAWGFIFVTSVLILSFSHDLDGFSHEFLLLYFSDSRSFGAV